MKKNLRFSALLLTVCLLIVSLSSCVSSLPTRPTVGGSQTPDASTQSYGLKYTLTQADLDEFVQLLGQCEELFLRPQVSKVRLTRMMERIDRSYTHIATQAQLAYIAFCVDREAPNASEDYLFASSAQADAYKAYMQMCQRIDQSASPNRDVFFKDWTEESLLSMRGYSDEYNLFRKSNDELLVAYRALDEDAFMSGSAELYLQMLQNNNGIAKLSGYENYWKYAYAEVYDRDFGADELALVRQYVKTYLLPVYAQALPNCRNAYAALTGEEQAIVSGLSHADYNVYGKELINGYLACFPGASQYTMRNLFEPRNSVFSDAAGAYEGAFTAYLYEPMRPVCYFGPGYRSTFTVIHEMGHYYAYTVRETPDVQLDLAEVHSQANEWLFLNYAEGELQQNVAQTLFLLQLCSALSSVILSTIVDDFEQRCYERQPETSEELDAIMSDVMSEYGGEEWLYACLANVPRYWRLVVLESPVYYISYAVSMLAALQIYCVAEERSLSDAQKIYLDLVRGSGTDEETSFVESLQAAGLSGPMEESVYQAILALSVRKGAADVSE